MKKFFIATGNSDKFKRMQKWFAGLEAELFSPLALEEVKANATKITDAEEMEAETMQARALLKAQKAAKVLTGIPVLAMDGTAYLPWLDLEIIDLRYPPRIPA